MRSRDLVLISICETKPPCSEPRSIAGVCGSSSPVAGVLTPFHTPRLIRDHSRELGHMTPMAVSTEPHFLVFRILPELLFSLLWQGAREHGEVVINLPTELEMAWELKRRKIQVE